MQNKTNNRKMWENSSQTNKIEVWLGNLQGNIPAYDRAVCSLFVSYRFILVNSPLRSILVIFAMQSHVHRRRAIFALVLVLNASVHLHDLRGFVQPGSLRTTHADSRCSDVVCASIESRMVPPKRKGDLELRRKKIVSFFLFYEKRRWVPRVVRYKFFAW